MNRKLVAATFASLLFIGTTAIADPSPAGPLAAPKAPRTRPAGITPQEAARLRTQAQELHQLQRKAHADGDVTRREQAAINRQAAQLRRMVHVAKTN